MENFGIGIQLNPGDSVAKAKQVEDSLAKTEEAARKAARELKDGMSGASKAFGPLVDAITKHQAALQRTTEIHNRLSAANQPLVQGFAKVAEQIEREKRALDGIRGPAQQAAQEIQTLNSMLAKGAITAGEFNAKLHAIRPPGNFRAGGASASGGFDASSAASMLPGGGIVAGAIGGGVAGAATAGLQTAAGAAREAIAMADAYTGLNNRLKALTGSQSEAAALFDKLHQSANKTYSDVNTTTDSYVKFARALKGVGATQDQAIKFTEHLNEVIAMSGTDAAGANAAMLQLGQALSSGVLRGEEFNSVIEQAPALLDPIAKHLGVTVGQLRGLAQQGKITSKIIFDSFNEAGPSIEKAFGQSVPTLSQQFQVLKNDVAVAVGELAKDVNLTKLAADSMAGLKDIVAASLGPVKLLNDGLHELGGTLGDLAGGGFSGIAEIKLGLGEMDDFMAKVMNGGKDLNDQQEVINRTVAAGTGHLNEYSIAQAKSTLTMQLGEGAAAAFAKAMDEASGKTDAWRDKTDSLGNTFSKLVNGAGNELVDWLTNTKGKLHELALAGDSWADATERNITINDRISVAMTNAGFAWDQLTKKIKKQAEAAKVHAKEMKELAKHLLGGNETAATRAIRDAKATIAGNESENDFIASLEQGTATAQLELFNAKLAQLDDLQKQAKISAEAYDTAKNKAYEDAFNKGLLGSGQDVEIKVDPSFHAMVEAQEELVRTARESAEETQKAWASALGGIGKNFIDAAMEGKESFSDMAEHMMKDIAKVVLQMAAMNMAKSGGTTGIIGTALGALLGGGANGFDYVANSNKLQLPGFATGGDFMVGGSGGTDSKIAMFRVTPGESVHVRTPAQQMQMGSGGQQGPTVIQLMNDHRDLAAAIGTNAGRREVVKIDRQLQRARRAT